MDYPGLAIKQTIERQEGSSLREWGNRLWQDTQVILAEKTNDKITITKEPNQKIRLGAASNKITGGLQLVCGRPTFALRNTFPSKTRFFFKTLSIIRDVFFMPTMCNFRKDLSL